jgi:cytochrome c oxidase assembly factor CtaG
VTFLPEALAREVRGKPRWPLTVRETVLLCIGLVVLIGAFVAPAATLGLGLMAITGAGLLVLAHMVAA